MHLSHLFGKRLREVPAEADTVSHQLLLRTGMINQLAAGVYSYLPLGWRVLHKIEAITRDEMDKAGGQEVLLPVLQPLEIWQQSGRAPAFGESLFTFCDRRDRNLCLGPTHEEVITLLVARNVQSYRDLPLMPYQIQTKFRDEPRPRGGLVRVREFVMKDLYSFDVDDAGLDISYNKMRQAYENIYRRCGLNAMRVEADSGAIGGKASNEFIVPAESGEDEIIFCRKCHYAANAEKAQSVKGDVDGGAARPLEEVKTPGMTSIEQVSGFLDIPTNRTIKAVFYMADGQLSFVVVRGDIEVNEVKLKNALHAIDLRMATEQEVIAAGIVPGFASPVGVKGVKVVADDSITTGTNFVAGANKPDTHYINVNFPRDFAADIITDIARAHAGERCPKCDDVLDSVHGIEVGHIFKLGTFLSGKLGATFINAEGVSQPIIMGCYGIGLGRLVAVAIEQNHDDKGITWPISIAPYQVYLCPLFMDNPAVAAAAEKIYADLEANGIEVLYDDRQESPGVKFSDADLLGIPLRITVSPRTLEKGNVEVKWRTEKKAELIPLEGIADQATKMVREALARLS